MRMVVENLSLQAKNFKNMIVFFLFQTWFKLIHILLKEQIGQMEVYCDFGIKDNTQDPDGCPDIIQLVDRKGNKWKQLLLVAF